MGGVSRAAIAALAMVAACTNDPAATGGDARPDRDAAHDVVGEGGERGDADDADVDREPVGGPMTLVIAEWSASLDRVCDLDGNGIADNSLDDLGEPSSNLVAIALNGVLAARLNAGIRVVFHFPWIDDLGVPEDPDTLAIQFGGWNLDCTGADITTCDLDDDFSGEEPFHIAGDDLDGCGEPLSVFPDTHL